jgi:predicted nucleotidyltransferase
MSTKSLSLADALFSKVQQRVLALFFCNSERSFYTNEVIRTVNSGTGAVSRELSKLTRVGLLVVKQLGNQKLYQANKDSVLFDELRNIAIKTFGVADVLRDALTAVVPRVRVAFVYGSIAKHEDTVNSDVDVMLIGDELSYTELYPLLEAAQQKLGRQVNPTCYAPEEWARKLKVDNHFITQIIKQPKIFLVGNDDDLTSIR